MVVQYQEINVQSLKTELEHFHLQYNVKCLKDMQNVGESLTNFEALVRLKLVCPA